MPIETMPGAEYLGWLVGMQWPDGNEDDMWTLAQDWRNAANSLAGIDSDIDAAISAVQAAYPDGSGGQAMIEQLKSMRTGPQSIDELVNWFNQIGDSAENTGNSLESAKIQFNVMLGVLMAEFAAALLFPPTAPEEDAVATAVARVTARAIFKKLLEDVTKEALKEAAIALLKNGLKKFALHLALNVLMTGGLDLGTQGLEMLQGHRKSINWTEVGQTTAGGLAGALAGGLFGGLAGKLGVGPLLTKMISGEAGMLGGWAANGLMTGSWQFDPRMLTAGAAQALMDGHEHEESPFLSSSSTDVRADDLALPEMGDGSVAHPGLTSDTPSDEPVASTGGGSAGIGGGDTGRFGTRGADEPDESAGSSDESAGSSDKPAGYSGSGSEGHSATGESHSGATSSTGSDDSSSDEGASRSGDVTGSPGTTSDGTRPADSESTDSRSTDSPPVDSRSGVPASSSPRVADTGDGSSSLRAPGRSEPSPVRTDSTSEPAIRAANPTRSAGVSESGGRGDSGGPIQARSAGVEAPPGNSTREHPMVSGTGEPRELASAGPRSHGDDGAGAQTDSSEKPTSRDQEPGLVGQTVDHAEPQKDSQNNRDTQDAGTHPADTPSTPSGDSPDIEQSIADNIKQTPGGIALDGGDLGDLPQLVKADPGYFTVDTHITDDGHVRIGDRTYTPEELGDALRNHGWDGEKPIRLIGGKADANNFADRLAAHTGADVLSPTKDAWSDNNGRVYSSSTVHDADGNPRPGIPPDGEWNTTHPDGTKTRASEDGFVPGTREADKHGLTPDHAQHRADQPTGEHGGQVPPGDDGHHEQYDHRTAPLSKDTKVVADITDLPGLGREPGDYGLITDVDGHPIDEHVDAMAHDRANQFRDAAKKFSAKPGENQARVQRRVQQGRQDGTYLGQKTHGAVSAIVLDPRTGEVFEGLNGKKGDIIPVMDLHQALRDNILKMMDESLRQPDGGFPRLGFDGRPEAEGTRSHPHFDNPLGHAEVKAADAALKARDELNRRLVEEGKEPLPAGADALKEFVTQTYKPFASGDEPKGTPYCANCHRTMGEARNFDGRYTGAPGGDDNLVGKYVPPDDPKLSSDGTTTPGDDGSGKPALSLVPKSDMDGGAESGDEGGGQKSGHVSLVPSDGVDDGDEGGQQSGNHQTQHHNSPEEQHRSEHDPSHTHQSLPPQEHPSIEDAFAHHSEETPAGVSLHQGDSVLGDLPQRVTPDDRYFTVDAHVTEDGHVLIGEHQYTPEEFGDALRNHGWDGEKPIRLIGCDASDNGFADRLAAHTGADVLASTKKAWTDEDGRVYSASTEIGPDGNRRPRIPPDGEWNISHPDGARTRAGEDGFVPGTSDDAKHGLRPETARARAAESGGRHESPAREENHQNDHQLDEFGHDEGHGAADVADPVAIHTFYHQLLDAARDASEGTGRGITEEIQQFTLQRAISRIFTVDPDSWVLKGGQSMLARIDGARPSTDIDLVATDRRDGADMAADYRAALERDHGDLLRFEYEEEMPLDSGGVRMFHRAYLGDMEVMHVGVDLNPPREIPMWHEPSTIRFPDQIMHTDGMGHEPDLRVISPQDTLAHKVSGMFTEGYRTLETKCDDCVFLQDKNLFTCQKAGSELPYRPQDMADVLLLALHTPFDGATTQAMLRQEFEWRMSKGVTLNVPEEFRVPNPDWGNWFSQHLGPTDGLPFRTLDETLPLAHDFLDPLLSPEDLHGQWDPQQRRWIRDGETPTTDLSSDDTATPAASAPEGVRRIEGTGVPEPSELVIDPENKMPQWDRFSGDTTELNDYLDRLTANDRMTPDDKVFEMHRELDKLGYKPEPISGMDSPHLRFYSHQSGEEYIHSAALMLNPDTTVEIAFQSGGVFKAYSEDAYASHIAFLGDLPEGMTADQANAVAFARWMRGEPIDDISHAELTRELLDLHAQPLRSALRIRQRLIEDYGIEPDRIRLANGGDGRDSAYTSTKWLRAHLFTLSEIREHPLEARQAMVDAMTGEGDIAASRSARVQSVVDGLFDEHEGDTGPKKYTLLWVRDSRPFGTHGSELDTRPEQVRQIIETLRDKQPDRQILLVGDDIFSGRPEMQDIWRREGVLDGVDSTSLVKFWEPDGLSRAEQSLVFHRLATERDVVQIGMESGALETQTVLGVPTTYLSAREYEGNKGNRWAHYYEPWEYGRTMPTLDEHGNQLYDPMSGLAKSEFQPEGEQLPAPLKTIERVPVGPDLPDPTNRRDQPVAVYRPAAVSLTSARIIGLIDSGELDHWSDRLGRSVGFKSTDWEPWQERDWRNSELYADQLDRWLHTDATTPEGVATKWNAIRLALKGVVEPGYTSDEDYHGTSVVHPYFTLSSDHPVPEGIATRIADAYAAEPQARPAAVVNALKQLFDETGLRDQAINDHAVFRLEPLELQNLHEALDRVIAQNTLHPVEPYDAPPSGSAWDAPGAATHSARPALENLWVPDYYRTHIMEGDGSGGHRYGTGIPGKTEFPARWDDETAFRYIQEIAAAPDRALFQRNGYWNVIGQRDDVTVTVIIRPDGRIRAAWPEFGPGVFRNPVPEP